MRMSSLLVWWSASMQCLGMRLGHEHPPVALLVAEGALALVSFTLRIWSALRFCAGGGTRASLNTPWRLKRFGLS